MLGESQTRPRAEGIEHTVEIFSFLREVIRAAAGINSRIISMTFDIKTGLSLPFFQIDGKCNFPICGYLLFRLLGQQLSQRPFSQILQRFKHDEGTILARVQRDFKSAV